MYGANYKGTEWAMTCDGHIRRSCAYRLSLSPYFFKNCSFNTYHLDTVRGKGKWRVGMSYFSLRPRWDLPYIAPASRNGMVRWFICGVNINLIIPIARKQALLFGRVKQDSRERASEGTRKGELATISQKFSFPPRKPRDSAKRENGHRKLPAD